MPFRNEESLGAYLQRHGWERHPSGDWTHHNQRQQVDSVEAFRLQRDWDGKWQRANASVDDEEKCASCRFFSPKYNHVAFFNNDDQGRCHKKAPLMNREGSAWWPMVRRNRWCGDHEYGTNPDKLELEQMNEEKEETDDRTT